MNRRGFLTGVIAAPVLAGTRADRIIIDDPYGAEIPPFTEADLAAFRRWYDAMPNVSYRSGGIRVPSPAEIRLIPATRVPRPRLPR